MLGPDSVRGGWELERRCIGLFVINTSSGDLQLQAIPPRLRFWRCKEENKVQETAPCQNERHFRKVFLTPYRLCVNLSYWEKMGTICLKLKSCLPLTRLCFKLLVLPNLYVSLDHFNPTSPGVFSIALPNSWTWDQKHQSWRSVLASEELSTSRVRDTSMLWCFKCLRVSRRQKTEFKPNPSLESLTSEGAP